MCMTENRKVAMYALAVLQVPPFLRKTSPRAATTDLTAICSPGSPNVMWPSAPSIMSSTESFSLCAVVQKALSSPDPQVKCADAWRLCFEQILFPLVTDLVKNRGTQVLS